MSLVAIPAVTADRRTRLDPITWLAAGKITVACLLAASFVVPAAGGFHGQALWLRGVVYPFGRIVLPAIWTARGRGRYPLLADAYLLAPFAFDAAGNSLGLYGRVHNFDNFSHLVGTVALTGFAGAMRATPSADRRVTILAAAGVATMLGIGVELTEWTAFTHPVATGYGAYRDTVGDLGMDVAGAALGAIALWLTGPAATAFDR
jgi:hypothetical protein